MSAEKKSNAAAASPTTPVKKIKLNLVGLDSNAFALMGHFRRQALREKWSQGEIKEVLDKCMSGDYNNLLNVLMEHCESEGDDE